MTDTPFIKETSGPPAIARSPTSIALFIGGAPSGPTDHAVRIASFADYEAAFGKFGDARSYLGYALGHFFDNGGRDALVLRIVGADGAFIAPADQGFVRALNAAFATGAPVTKIKTFNLICVPGLADPAAIAMLQGQAVARRAFVIVDCAETETVASVQASLATRTGTNAANSALYFPWVIAPDALQNNAPRAFPPCGFVAGIYTRVDLAHGVWKAPAGTDDNLVGATGLTVLISEADQNSLNPLGINCLRKFSSTEFLVWGARTLAGADPDAPDWKYVNVRRTALFLENSLYAGTQWAVFEPNGEPLWAKLRASTGDFMLGLFRDGAFQGNTASQAFFVKCDTGTTTQADIDRGIVNIMVGFAPLEPAEFVILTITQLTAAPTGARAPRSG